MYKKAGTQQTKDITSEMALKSLKNGLRSDNTAYIYHCWDHYMCPIGFEETPKKPIDAYSLQKDIEEFDNWIMIGDIDYSAPVFYSKKWEMISQDISLGFPEFMNIRKSDIGV